MNKKQAIFFRHHFLICLCSLMSISQSNAQTLSQDELQTLKRQSESNNAYGSETFLKLGEYYLDAGMQDSAIHFLRLASQLTDAKHKNQFVILLYTALGYSGKGMTDSAQYTINKALNGPEIAAELILSPFTVETHRKNLLQKFQVNSTQKLLLSAKNFGML